MIQVLANQLISEMRRNRQKTAILAVSLVIGLYFWLPLLFNAFKGRGSSIPKAAAAIPRPIEAVAAFPSSTSTRSAEGGAKRTWEQVVQLLQNDPLFRPAEASSIRSDAFQIDHDQFSPPVDDIFMPDSEETPVRAKRADAKPSIDGLALKSTIIGVKQRAAFINDRLYFEGNVIPWKGASYVVEAIRPRSVALTSQDATYELMIDDGLSRELDSRGTGLGRRETKYEGRKTAQP